MQTKCDIYFSKIPANALVSELVPAERNAELMSVKNECLCLEKYWSWRTLEFALLHSFGYKMSDLIFSRSQNGKWLCDKCFFSLSHSGGYVAVAVSNTQVGIDIEDVLAFEEKCKDSTVLKRMRRHIAGKSEPYPKTPFELLKIWTQKESIFKCKSEKSFNPAKIELTEDVESLRLTHENSDFLCSVTGKDIKKSVFYYYNGEETSRIEDIVWI